MATKILSDDEMVERLILAGWSKEEAEKEVKQMIEDGAIENGMGGE